MQLTEPLHTDLSENFNRKINQNSQDRYGVLRGAPNFSRRVPDEARYTRYR